MGETPLMISIRLTEITWLVGKKREHPRVKLTIETSYGGHHDKRDIYVKFDARTILDFGTRPVEAVVEDT